MLADKILQIIKVQRLSEYKIAHLSIHSVFSAHGIKNGDTKNPGRVI